MRNTFILLLLLFHFAGYSQDNILDNPAIQHKVESCLNNTYNFNFKEARALQKEIEKALPQHPVTDFLDALIIYWEYMPLLPDTRQAESFLNSMERSISRSRELLKEDNDDLEGVFFDLHARALIAMFWADNGKSQKVIWDIDNLYRRTMQGIEMKEEFIEFYFSSGLYNYYVEAYLEAHPVYKPLGVLFRKGDKEKGLQEMQLAIDNCTYIRVEAIHFMYLLQLNYEENISKAVDYAAILYNSYPNNTYFTGLYLTILLYQNEFELADAILQRLDKKDDKYSDMLRMIFKGFLAENSLKDTVTAERFYQDGIKKAAEFGPFADIYQAIAYAGLSRIYEKNGDRKLSKNYSKNSSSYSKYEFIQSYDR